ncbi:MAG: alpha/beta hydrolase [bacterium]|nr:alpha/beta hydrolase [bacterium]
MSRPDHEQIPSHTDTDVSGGPHPPRVRRMAWLPLFLLTAVVAVLVVLVLNRTSGTARVRPADQTETTAGQTFNHYFTEAAGITWHHVETGDGDPIVFLHGIPGAWFSWHSVMAQLSDQYRTVALDMKGLGLTEPGSSTFNLSVVAGETVALLDALGIERFALVSHEWGAVAASYIAAQYPQRVTHLIRLQTPISDAALAQINTLKSVPSIGMAVLGDGEGFVRRMYTGAVSSLLMANVPGNVVTVPLEESVIARIAQEFSYAGIPQAIVNYYTDTPTQLRETLFALAADTPMPVLLLQADSDPIQPLTFYTDAAAAFPNAVYRVIPNAGHAPMLEQPETVAGLIHSFVSGTF